MAGAKRSVTLKIRKLGIGSIFAVMEGAVKEHWKIIGRPGKSGLGPDGKQTYTVKAIYVARSKDDPYTPSKEAKYFEINRDVEEVRPARKDFDAIDQRDQPTDVVSIERLAAQLGTEFEVKEGGSVEELADEEK